MRKIARNMALLSCLVPLLACASEPVLPSASVTNDYQPDSRPMARTMVYECEDMEFITRVGPGEMALWLEDRYLVLSQVRSASGTKYQEDDVVFWSKGDEVMLEVAGRTYRDCRLNLARAPWEDARRRGVDFRAVGNEPGWSVEVHGKRSLLFEGDYGASKVLFQELTSTDDGSQVFYEARRESAYISVTAVEEACTDTMKGEVFPYTVTVHLDEKRYDGCGRKLDHPWHR